MGRLIEWPDARRASCGLALRLGQPFGGTAGADQCNTCEGGGDSRGSHGLNLRDDRGGSQGSRLRGRVVRRASHGGAGAARSPGRRKAADRESDVEGESGSIGGGAGGGGRRKKKKK